MQRQWITALPTVCLLLAFSLPVTSLAIEANGTCTITRINAQASIDFPTAYVAIAARAIAWQPDAKLVTAGHTFGAVDTQGRSKRWRINYFSSAAQRGVSFDVDKGVLSCQESSGLAAPYIPELKLVFETDVKRVLALAASHGGAEPLAKGYVAHVQLGTYPGQHLFDGSSNRAVWSVNYLRRTVTQDGESQNEDSDSMHVVIDANTGDFIYAQSPNAWWKFWR